MTSSSDISLDNELYNIDDSYLNDLNHIRRQLRLLELPREDAAATEEQNFQKMVKKIEKTKKNGRDYTPPKKKICLQKSPRLAYQEISLMVADNSNRSNEPLVLYDNIRFVKSTSQSGSTNFSQKFEAIANIPSSSNSPQDYSPKSPQPSTSKNNTQVTVFKPIETPETDEGLISKVWKSYTKVMPKSPKKIDDSMVHMLTSGLDLPRKSTEQPIFPSIVNMTKFIDDFDSKDDLRFDDLVRKMIASPVKFAKSSNEKRLATIETISQLSSMCQVRKKQSTNLEYYVSPLDETELRTKHNKSKKKTKKKKKQIKENVENSEIEQTTCCVCFQWCFGGNTRRFFR